MLPPSEEAGASAAPEKKKKKKKKKKVKEAAAAEGGEGYTGGGDEGGGDEEMSVVFEGGNVSPARSCCLPSADHPTNSPTFMSHFAYLALFGTLLHLPPPPFLIFVALFPPKHTTCCSVLATTNNASCRARGRIGQRCPGGLLTCTVPKLGQFTHMFVCTPMVEHIGSFRAFHRVCASYTDGRLIG